MVLLNDNNVYLFYDNIRNIKIGDPYYNSSLIKDKCKDDNIK
jgi:hypothetical protein